MKGKLLGYRFVVKGYGAFPIDMLRYDQAWPDREEDSGRIHDALERRRVDDTFIPVVRLRSIHAPTIGRWSSFGWRVEDIEEVRA